MVSVRRGMSVFRAMVVACSCVAALCLMAAVGAAPARAASAPGTSGADACIGHHFATDPSNPIWYTSGCTGHDEPELDPISSLAGSARDLTWTAVLPTDGTVPVSAVGPTFWWGGAVTDPKVHALFGQAFLEVQFYPDSIVKSCSASGGFNVSYAPNKFTVCSPVWQVSTNNNAELYQSGTKAPLVMSGGDTIQIHFHVVSQQEGWNVTVSDLTTGQSGTIVLNSAYGPLLPLFSAQKIGNALRWGAVDDTPNAFVWEIGHTSPFTTPAAKLCLPGQIGCDSYDAAHWAGFSPLQIKSVTFANGSSPAGWATVSDYGGAVEVNQYCSAYGGPYCIYPWYANNGTDSAFTYGVDYPGTKFDCGQAGLFAPTTQCGGAFGPDSTYCDSVLRPSQ